MRLLSPSGTRTMMVLAREQRTGCYMQLLRMSNVITEGGGGVKKDYEGTNTTFCTAICVPQHVERFFTWNWGLLWWRLFSSLSLYGKVRIRKIFGTGAEFQNTHKLMGSQVWLNFDSSKVGFPGKMYNRMWPEKNSSMQHTAFSPVRQKIEGQRQGTISRVRSDENREYLCLGRRNYFGIIF